MPNPVLDLAWAFFLIASFLILLAMYEGYEALINRRFARYGFSTFFINRFVRKDKRRKIVNNLPRIRLYGVCCVLFLLGGIPEHIRFFIDNILPSISK